MSTVELKLTEGQLNNAMAIAIAESFTPEKKDAMLRDLFRAILTTPVTNSRYSYEKETLFSQTVVGRLKKMMTEELEKHVESLRPEVDQLVAEAFGKSVKVNIIDSLKTQLNRVAVNNLTVSVRVDD